MKKLLLAITAVFAISFANAQCTPDPQYTSPGIYPDSATNFMAGQELVAYAQTVTAVVPPDTCAQILPLPFPCTTLTLDSIVVESVTGLPNGLTFQCDNAECQYPGGQTGCAIIAGTPALGTAGTWPLTISLSAYVGGIANPYTLEYYEIVILPAVNSVNENENNAFAIKQNKPNPFDDITSIEYSLTENGKVTFEVYNLVGELVDSKSISGNKGMNRFQFDGSELANGAYIYKMTNNGNTITKRMVISR